MNKFLSLFLSAALVTSTMAFTTVVPAEAGGYKYSKSYCASWARQKADRKTSRKVVRNLVVGGIAGGLFGAAVGGRKSTVLGVVGGGAVGVVAGDATWRKSYNRYYQQCRNNY
jgi:uncharacterized protein YcfJ